MNCHIKHTLLWLRIVRPQTLPASVCPVVVGLLVVSRESGLPNVWAGAVTILCALTLQILSNLINDLYDYRRGSDKAGRKGFKRALAEGEVSEKQMLTACLIALGVAVLSGLYLVWIGGWPILAIGVSALVFAWLYTATDHSLSYLGIADIFVYLYYGLLATEGTIWLQCPNVDAWPLLRIGAWGGSVCGLISMMVLMINNLRDMEDDRRAGKRTLPVRWGKTAAEVLMLLVCIAVPVAAWMAYGNGLICCVGLTAVALWIAVLRAQGAQYNRCLMAAGIINILYVVLVALCYC